MSPASRLQYCNTLLGELDHIDFVGPLGCLYKILRVPSSFTGLHFVLFCKDLERASSEEG